MWHRVVPNHAVRLLLVAIVLIGILLAWLLPPKVSQASENSSHMRTLLEQLNERIAQEPGFLVTFQFRTPLAAEEDAWTLGDPNDERERVITDLGEDYICLRERGGGAIFVRCVLFSNIVSVSYLDN